MPILLVGALFGVIGTHFWHTEVKRQAQQEARLNELHEKMSAHMAAINAAAKK